MDQATHSYSSSSSSSSNNRPLKTSKPTRPSYTNSLHSVRKLTEKPITKQFIAPLPPTPVKVYKVNSSNFKQVVRMLTSSPQFQSPAARRLKAIAPPPLILKTMPKPSILPEPQPQPQPPLSAGCGTTTTTTSPLSGLTFFSDVSKLLNEAPDASRFITSNSPVMEYFGSLNPLGLSLSPAPQSSFDPSGVGLTSPLGLNMSPSSLSWCSSLLLDPAKLTGFKSEPHPVSSSCFLV